MIDDILSYPKVLSEFSRERHTAEKIKLNKKNDSYLNDRQCRRAES